jgi:hypothetical protein
MTDSDLISFYFLIFAGLKIQEILIRRTRLKSRRDDMIVAQHIPGNIHLWVMKFLTANKNRG